MPPRSSEATPLVVPSSPNSASSSPNFNDETRFQQQENGYSFSKDYLLNSKRHHQPTCKSNRALGLLVASAGYIALVACVAVGVTFGRLWEFKSHEHHSKSQLQPKYTKFQALGLQIFTGGAPVYFPDRPTTDDSKDNRNPECFGRTSYGYLDDEDSDGRRNIYCYVGESDDSMDVARRLEVMKQAMERAYQIADPDPSVLKVFNVPEFYWRGKDGAYFFDEGDELDGECGDICHVLRGLEDLTADARFEDWLFLFGTIITAEKVPMDDKGRDYVFLNFAPLYRGYNPKKTSHVGQRFILPKRYISNMDFLTPLRHYNSTLAREIIEDPTEPENDTTIFNPFLERRKYSNHVWDSYKQELDHLEYTMIEYDWVIIDGIIFTVEVCVDHDKAIALDTYIADAVTGRSTRIPKVDAFKSSIEQVPIPHEMAQISLVSSAGMNVNRRSIATANQGYVFLQDGMTDKPPNQYIDKECLTGIAFEGSTELIHRYAVLSPNNVMFEHQISTDYTLHSVFDGDWKSAIRGVFSTAKYEPRISLYPPKDIPQLPPK